MPKLVENKAKKVEIIGVRVNASFKKELEEFAKKMGVSLSDFIRLTMQNKLQNLKKGDKNVFID